MSSSKAAEETIFYSNRTQRRASYAADGVSMMNQLLLFAITALAIILGMAPMGAILSVGNLCGTFFTGVSNLVQSVMTIRSSRPLWEKFQGEETVSAAKKPLAPVEKITMEDVSFRYGERVILDQRDFVFEAGGKYAVLGESGSGKTTVLKLLMGLLPDYEGKICYDGCEQNLMENDDLGVIIITHNLHDCVRKQLTGVYQM